MDIERIFKLFWQGFDLEFFLDELRLQVVNLVFEGRNAIAFLHEYFEFSLEVLLFVVEQFEISKSFPEGSLSFRKGGLLNFDFLIQKGGLIVSSDQLGSQNVPFSDNQFIFIFAMLPFVLRLFDGVMEFGDFVETVFDLLPSFIHLFLLLLQLPAVL